MDWHFVVVMVAAVIVGPPLRKEWRRSATVEADVTANLAAKQHVE